MVSEEDLDRARDLIANGAPEAVGYRILIKPIEAVSEMEVSQKEKYPTLAKSDFQSKTDNQKERESKGTFHGLVVHVGDFAYKTEQLGGKPWIVVGDVVLFDRYAGVEMDLPPGSGEKYRFVNDESVLGKMVTKNV
jgi:co-chaperonin GroES (HSP10)